METDPNEAAHFRMMLELGERDVLHSTFDMLNVDVLAWDAATGNVVFANTSARAKIGASLREVCRKNIYSVLPDLSPTRLKRFLVAVSHRAQPELTFHLPQVNTVSGEIIGFESLIRWRHPVRGLVPAGVFLTAAEGSGLIDELDNVIMDRSCYAVSQLISWKVTDPCVSINMSMSQLRDPAILSRLMHYIDAHKIQAANLRIELLESTLLDERSSVIVNNVHRLIEAGFSVELDDFGTGHAAIATLRKFSVGRIKIDRSLVEGIDHDSELQVITGAIINLADRLGIGALAEGVETLEEQKTLQVLGCACAQGYLHARPMPLSEVRDWIRTHQLKQTA